MKRLDLKVGFQCNNLCRFCVQGDKRYRFGEKSFEQVKKELEEGRTRKIESLVLTGGEPTVHPNIVEIVQTAHDLGYKIIQIQSNGRSFSDEKFLDKLIEAGATEFAPALHGHKPEIHDFLTRVPGAWKQTVKGILNIRERGFPVIMNSVVTKPNYRYMHKLGDLFVKLDVTQYQLAFVHALGTAEKYFDSIVPRMALAAPYIKKGLDPGIDAGLLVMTEAMTYCLMDGYEKYLSELYVPKSSVFDADYFVEDFDGWRVHEGKVKFPQCASCKFRDICEGPWREYPERRGCDEFIPVEGPVVTKKDILGK